MRRRRSLREGSVHRAASQNNLLFGRYMDPLRFVWISSIASHERRQLFDAIAYLHSKHITHRDLKYENIMFASAVSTTVKIIDFGLSKKYGKKMNELCGTTYTMAPEVLKGRYDERCDNWSLGVITFMLVSSSIPFYGDTRSEIADQILEPRQWKLKGRRWKGTSKEAKDFIRKLLVHDTSQRLSATQALEHAWFKNYDDRNKAGCGNDDNIAQINVSVMDRVLTAIQTFAWYSRLKKLALLIIAHQSIDEDKEIGFLRHLFLQRFDTEKASANVSYPEFKMALKGYKYSNEELTNMFNNININGTGKISFTEFLASTIESHGHLEEERIAEAFDRIDNDDSGYITVENLQDILGEDVAEGYLDEIIDEVEYDEHGYDRHVSYTQFLGLWDEDSDDKLRLALMDVQRRRLIVQEERNSFRITPSTSAGSLDDDEEYSGTRATFYQSGNEEDWEIGSSLFEIEKAKSLRGLFE